MSYLISAGENSKTKFSSRGFLCRVNTSACGPFQGSTYMYEKILEDAFQLEEGNEFWHFLMFLTKPGVVAGVLLTMWLVSVSIYLSIVFNPLVNLRFSALITSRSTKKKYIHSVNLEFLNILEQTVNFSVIANF